MKLNNTHKAFLELVRAGLWEMESRLAPFEPIDFMEVYRLAEEQSVVGLVAAGLEHLTDVKIPQEVALTFAGTTLQLEQRNKGMNLFISKLIEKMRYAGIYALLVKGQGIAQCYERPLWRACGDVDLLLSKDNYKKADALLSAMASHVEDEHIVILHKAMTIDNWEVELHGTLHSKLGRRIDRTIDKVQNDVFCGGAVRSWMNGYTQVFIPRADEDVVFVFAHILQHFFNGGIGLRQICDWCRLLWVYKDSIDRKLLEKRVRSMGLMTEWKAFAALAVQTLGIKKDAMPFYTESTRWTRKAEKIFSIVMASGNMGHSRDWSYRQNYSTFVRRLFTLSRLTGDAMRQFTIFPKDSLRVWWLIVSKGVCEAAIEKRKS